MLLQTAKRQPAASGLTPYDNEYGGNTPFPHIPISYDNAGTFVEGGTVGAAQYTGTKTVYSSSSATAPYASGGDVMYADGNPQSSTEFVALIDTTAWTRYDGLTPREFLLGIDYIDAANGNAYINDSRYFRPDGTSRAVPIEDYMTHKQGAYDLYTVSDIGITPSGVMLVFFSFPQVWTPSGSTGFVVFGPVNEETNGTAAFSILRLN